MGSVVVSVARLRPRLELRVQYNTQRESTDRTRLYNSSAIWCRVKSDGFKNVIKSRKVERNSSGDGHTLGVLCIELGLEPPYSMVGI